MFNDMSIIKHNYNKIYKKLRFNYKNNNILNYNHKREIDFISKLSTLLADEGILAKPYK
jgi:hypothetical protein